MRRWRKIWKNISVSDKIAQLSYEAKWLYILLVLYQDDRGLVAYSRSKIKSMVAGSTEWNLNDIQRFIAELDRSQLIVMNDTFIEIVGGSEKNGNPYKFREPAHYDIAELQHVKTENNNVVLNNLKIKKLNNTKIKNIKGKSNEKSRIAESNTKSKFKDNG